MLRYITNIVDVTLYLKAQKLRTLLMLRYVKIEEIRTWLMLRYLKVEKLLGVGSFWTVSLACKTASQSKPSTYVPSTYWRLDMGSDNLLEKMGKVLKDLWATCKAKRWKLETYLILQGIFSYFFYIWHMTPARGNICAVMFLQYLWVSNQSTRCVLDGFLLTGGFGLPLFSVWEQMLWRWSTRFALPLVLCTWHEDCMVYDLEKQIPYQKQRNHSVSQNILINAWVSWQCLNLQT